MSVSRVRHAGDAALLIELEPTVDPQVNARAQAIAETLLERALKGVRDVVPTYRSVAVHFDPLSGDVAAIWAACEAALAAPARTVQGRLVELPVRYGGSHGPDLTELSATTGLSEDEIVRRHAAVDYRVFMLGFQPGFPYLGIVDERIAAPRKVNPRLRVAKGSVGIAGRQTGVYPRESPGGWQIVGRTDVELFDATRAVPSLLAPGDTVRFVPASSKAETDINRSQAGHSVTQAVEPSTARSVTVVAPGLFTTVQDLGRWGHQRFGVTVGGAMDRHAQVAANRALGNDDNAATLEVTLTGPELRFEQPARIAVTGADLSPLLNGQPLPAGMAVACDAGAVLRFGQRVAGARAYIAFDGGIDVPIVLGSRSTHTASSLGGYQGRALRAGDRLLLGPAADAVRAAEPVSADRPSRPSASRALTDVRLRVLPGPQRDRFGVEALDVLRRKRFRVSPQSNRMGYRLSGANLPAPEGGEMISDATFPGGIQVPPSGEPILLMADRQTTGGYPQLAVVITADLPAAGQLAPDDWVAFEPCDVDAARVALKQQPVG